MIVNDMLLIPCTNLMKLLYQMHLSDENHVSHKMTILA